MRASTRVALGAALLCGALTTPAAQATTSGSIRPALSPDKLGARAALTLGASFSGGAEGVPAPLSRLVVHLPAGLRIDVRGVSACSQAALRSRGAKGCPPSSLVGRGSSLMAVRLGVLTEEEPASIWAFRGPNHGGRPTLVLFGQGYTPLEESVVFSGALSADRPPYGLKLSMDIPPIPTLEELSSASTLRFSLTVGTHRGGRRGAIVVPRSCPPGGFPFASDFSFRDGSTSTATTTVRCP